MEVVMPCAARTGRQFAKQVALLHRDSRPPVDSLGVEASE